MNHTRRVFVCLLGLVVILSILVFPVSAQGNDSGAAKSEEDYLLQSQRNFDRSLSILNTVATLIGIMVGILAIFIAIAAGLGFLEIKNWHKMRTGVEKKAENVTKIINRTKNEIEELRKGIPQNLLTEMPEQEILDKLNEVGNRLETLELLDVSLKLEDYLNRGNDFYYKKDYESALKAFDKAIELKPDDADAWVNKGAALGNMNRYDKALEALDKAIELKPDYAEAWLNKGSALGYMNRYDKALEAFEKAIELKPDDADTWLNLAFTYSLIGNKEKALSNLKKSIELNSSKKDAAKKAGAFKNLWDDEDFKKLLE